LIERGATPWKRQNSDYQEIFIGPDQATRIAESSIEDARAANHVTSLCRALVLAACPIALWTGNLTAAESYVSTLLDHSTRHPLARWRAFGRGYEGVLAIKRGDVASGLRLLRAGFDELGEANTVFRFSLFLSGMAEALGRAGQIVDGLVTIEEAIERSEHAEEHWVMSEFLRVKGELLRLQTRPEPRRRPRITSAKRSTGRAGKVRCPGSYAPSRTWRGCCAIRAAPLMRWRSSSRSTTGSPKGFETAELKTARSLLDALAEPAGPR
jgi:hypothetical protein